MERIKVAIERARAQASHAEAYAVTTHTSRVPRTAELRPVPVRPIERRAPAHVTRLDPVHLEQNRIIGMRQAHPLRQSFDLLRTQVLQKMEEHGWRTLAITSPSVQSGKSVVAINLAMSIAHHPAKKALLVDFDLRRPTVAKYLGLPEGNSLNEVFAGEVDAEDAIVHAGMPGFEVLPTQRRIPGAGEILASDQVGHLLADLRDHDPDRILVIDLPPVTAVDDVIAVLPRVDCVLLVVGNGTSTREEIEMSKRHLSRFNVLGVVVNKAPQTRIHSGYY